MKSILLVLLPVESGDLEAALGAALEPHRLNEEDPASIRAPHWDYWVYLDDPPRFRTAVECLADLERVAGVLTPDGRWHDLQEHGWRMLDGDSRANRAAWDRWQAAARALLDRWGKCPAIEVIVHS
ncbi:MAG: hypothetical protein JSR82_04290 [Verrucomicrobia bacterium]|nr:hypothetical protein [Verrucomicrobiota bacterium]